VAVAVELIVVEDVAYVDDELEVCDCVLYISRSSTQSL
jgi:hypothetical protein